MAKTLSLQNVKKHANEPIYRFAIQVIAEFWSKYTGNLELNGLEFPKNEDGEPMCTPDEAPSFANFISETYDYEFLQYYLPDDKQAASDLINYCYNKYIIG